MIFLCWYCISKDDKKKSLPTNDVGAKVNAPHISLHFMQPMVVGFNKEAYPSERHKSSFFGCRIIYQNNSRKLKYVEAMVFFDIFFLRNQIYY